MSNWCDACGQSGPSAPACFSHNVGMLIMRRSEHSEGDFCSSCLWKVFGKHMFLNAILGWWGTISFIMTLYYFVKNVAELAGGLASVGSAGARVAAQRREKERARDETDPATALPPFRHTVRMRLGRGEDPDAIAEDMADIANVSLGAARAFVDECAER